MEVSGTEDALSVDVNARLLGTGPKALSGIEFLKTRFNQQVFEVRITPPSSLPAKVKADGGRAGVMDCWGGWGGGAVKQHWGGEEGAGLGTRLSQE